MINENNKLKLSETIENDHIQSFNLSKIKLKSFHHSNSAINVINPNFNNKKILSPSTNK